jgi:hypothetical protein
MNWADANLTEAGRSSAEFKEIVTGDRCLARWKRSLKVERPIETKELRVPKQDRAVQVPRPKVPKHRVA